MSPRAARGRMRRGGVARRVALLALAGGLLACDAPTATAPVPTYDFTQLTRGVSYRWPLGREIRVHAEMVNLPGGVDLPGAVARGLAAWNGVPGFAEFRLVPASGAADADVLVFHSGPTGAAGVTLFCPAGVVPDSARTLPLAAGSGGGRVKIVIRVDASRTGDFLDAVVAHELGHALGIGGHSASSDDLMFAAPRVPRPSARDVRTLRAVLATDPAVRL